MKHGPRNIALIVPLILVNAAATFGQSLWAHGSLHYGGWGFAILFATAIETVGIYLAAEAHAALMAGHSSGLLRLGSYAVGALSGSLNYAHFADPGYTPNPLAVTFGVLSSISPWLWAIRSRSMNRDRLYAAGLIDPRAVRFSRLRWLLFPTRTFVAFRLAVWDGIQSPAEAVQRADARRAIRRAKRHPIQAPIMLASVPDDSDSEDDSDSDTAEPATGPATERRLELVRPPVRHARPATRSASATRDEVIKRHRDNPTRSASDIATEVGISKRTAERHIASIRRDSDNDSDRSDIS